MTLKSLLLPLVWATSLTLACANTAPTVVIQSAAMRPGTTLMDVVYRVNDPDDATVKTRALAFVDGVRSFANVLKPVTFVEGTAAKLGDAIPSNTNHTLTWDVGADWNIDLGQVKFEVLAMDGRGLLPFDWITIPAAGGKAALTISKNSPTNAEVLNALFWQYASGDTGLSLAGGILTGNASSGFFDQWVLANGSTLQDYSTPFILKRIGLDTGNAVLANERRANVDSPEEWHASNSSYSGLSMIAIIGGRTDLDQTPIPSGVIQNEVVAIDTGYYHNIALRSDGTLVGWGWDIYGQSTIPSGLHDVIAISAGGYHNLALKSDGTVVTWGDNQYGLSTIPLGLSGVIAISAGGHHSLALKSDGTVVGWGYDGYGQTTIPAGLSGVIAIAAGTVHNLALKSDGTIVGWGSDLYGRITIPAGLSGVTAIAAGGHNLALKSDGTVVAWGGFDQRINQVPSGLSGVVAIAAGSADSLVLKSDGTVVGWGFNQDGQTTIPAGLDGVAAISAGDDHGLVLKAKVP